MRFWKTYRQFTFYRQILLLVGGIGLMGSMASLVSQYGLGFDPCVMCIQQRVAMMVMTLVALTMLILPVKHGLARWLAAIFTSLPALFGAYIASKQLYIQSLPITEQPSCGAPWTFRLRGQPLFDLYEPIIRGTGACGEIHKILGLTFPMWALIFFVIMLIILWTGVWWAKRRLY